MSDALVLSIAAGLIGLLAFGSVAGIAFAAAVPIILALRKRGRKGTMEHVDLPEDFGKDDLSEALRQMMTADYERGRIDAARECAEIADAVGSQLADVRDMSAGGAFDVAREISAKFGIAENNPKRLQKRGRKGC